MITSMFILNSPFILFAEKKCLDNGGPLGSTKSKWFLSSNNESIQSRENSTFQLYVVFLVIVINPWIIVGLYSKKNEWGFRGLITLQYIIFLIEKKTKKKYKVTVLTATHNNTWTINNN